VVSRLRAQQQDSSLPIRKVEALIATTGGVSGGTLATGMLQKQDPVMLTRGVNMLDPFLLGGRPKGGARDEDRDESLHRVRALSGGLFAAPSTMQPINSRVVRRSASLLNWGPSFSYTEESLLPEEKMAIKSVRAARSPAPPEVVARLVAEGKQPAPGQGPSPKQRSLSRFLCVLEATADNGSKLSGTVTGGCAGYEETARMVIEAALSLALEPHLCPGTATGGLLPPAVAIGENLIRRLHDVGILFNVLGDAESAEARSTRFFAEFTKLQLEKQSRL